jgi:hypothetical protein
MGHADYLRNGTYNGICDRCGSKFKFSDLKLEWDGLYVCTANGCWEPRQPQDYVKGIRDDMAVPVSRPEAGNMFLQQIMASCSTLASILYIIIPNRFNRPKLVNGAALNTVTLG